MKIDYINEKDVIKNTIINLEKNKEEIKLDINQIRNEIKRETQPNIPFLLVLSSLI